jgi:hypothetical protein
MNMTLDHPLLPAGCPSNFKIKSRYLKPRIVEDNVTASLHQQRTSWPWLRPGCRDDVTWMGKGEMAKIGGEMAKGELGKGEMGINHWIQCGFNTDMSDFINPFSASTPLHSPRSGLSRPQDSTCIRLPPTAVRMNHERRPLSKYCIYWI